jgi:phage gpG-like protein
MPAPKLPVRGLRIDVDLKFEFQPSIGISAKRMEKFGMDIRSFREPLKRSIQRVLAPSFHTNFSDQGRPERWQPLAEATVNIRGSATPILVRTGLLARTMRQFNIWSINNTQAAITDLPSKVWYGKVQQGGYQAARASKARSLHDIVERAKSGHGAKREAAPIPARPFALIQDPDDYDAIEKVFEEWLMERMVASKAFRVSGA